jgi:hypothetical protein
MNGGDGYTAFTTAGDLGLIDADAIQDYIKSQPGQLVSPKIEGRITYLYNTLLPLITRPAAAGED